MSIAKTFGGASMVQIFITMPSLVGLDWKISFFFFKKRLQFSGAVTANVSYCRHDNVLCYLNKTSVTILQSVFLSYLILVQSF